MSGPLTVAVAVGGAVLLAATSIAVRDRAVVLSSIVGPVRSEDGASRTPHLRGGRWLAGAALAAPAGIVGFVVAGPGGAAAGALAVVLAPIVRRRRRRAIDAAALEDGLIEAVSAIAAAIRAGRSMTGALEEAAATVPPPLGPRLQAVVDRIALGAPVERALLKLALSVPGPDGRLVAAVLGLHQRTGGAAPVVLDRVARTLRERRASAREVRSLTAQARLSGAILGLLPPVFFLFLSVTARADVTRALGSTAGRTAVVIGSGMQAAAFLWIRRLLRVDA